LEKRKLLLNRHLLAIDGDRYFVRLLSFRRERGGRVVVHQAISEPTEPGLVLDDAEKLGAFIRAAAEKHHLSFDPAVCAVGRERAFLHALTIPATPDDQVANLVRFQLAQELPFAIEESVVDYVVTARREDGNVTGVLAAAVKTEFLEYLQLAFRKAGLSLRQVGLRPFANLLAVRDATGAAGANVLFVDLGLQGLEIDFIKSDGVLEFSRNVGLEDTPAQTTPLKDAFLEQAILQVKRTLQAQAYMAGALTARPERVLVAGATGWEGEFASRVTSQLSLPAQVFSLPEAGFEQSAFATCYGLARGQTRSRQDQFNFLAPKKAVDPRAVRSRYYRLAVGAAAAFMILGFIYSRGQVGRAERELAGLQAEEKRLGDDVKKFNQFAEQMDQVHTWMDKRVDWLGQMKRLSEFLPPNDRIYLSDLRLAGGGESSDVFVDISLNGQTRSRQDIDKLAQILAEKGRYKVTLGQQATLTGEYPETFRITLAGKKAVADREEPGSVKKPVPAGGRTSPPASVRPTPSLKSRMTQHE
jgi:Tfp pilus assembly PilM family ATPase/Tfp pilus assembly protein PilN